MAPFPHRPGWILDYLTTAAAVLLLGCLTLAGVGRTSPDLVSQGRSGPTAPFTSPAAPR